MTITTYKIILAVILAAAAACFTATPRVRAQTPTPPSHANANCLMCHADPDFKGRLGNGELISLSVDPADHYRSVHADAGLECAACHIDQKDYPHRRSQITCLECHTEVGGTKETIYKPLVVDLPYGDQRELTLKYNEGCRECHEENFMLVTGSAHARVQASGNLDAPVCVDCHGNHLILPPNEPRQRISETCKTCHLSVYSSYKSSVHGSALETESNPDVPTCIDCHGAHKVTGPRDPEFRNNSILTCGGCHADDERMAKYGISTQVFNTYLDDFHGRTVNLFRSQDPDFASNKATCFDCHGVHNIRPHTDPQSTVYPANLQGTCQQCHADASITFPQAWLSHYIPTWERTPVLFAANKVYSILVPVTVTGFIGYIGLDARRRFADRRRKQKSSSAEVVYVYEDDESQG